MIVRQKIKNMFKTAQFCCKQTGLQWEKAENSETQPQANGNMFQYSEGDNSIIEEQKGNNMLCKITLKTA